MPTWIRVRDTSTGGEYDVEAHSLPLAPGVERVPGYPDLSGSGARPRPAKHHTSKSGRRAPRRRAAPPTPPPARPADIEGDEP